MEIDGVSALKLRSRSFQEAGPLFPRDRLLSAWGYGSVFDVGGPIPEIASEIARNLKQSRFGRIAPNPGNALRNQVRNAKPSDANGNVNGDAKSTMPVGFAPYMSVKIVYGKLGIKDFDFQ